MMRGIFNLAGGVAVALLLAQAVSGTANSATSNLESLKARVSGIIGLEDSFGGNRALQKQNEVIKQEFERRKVALLKLAQKLDDMEKKRACIDDYGKLKALADVTGETLDFPNPCLL